MNENTQKTTMELIKELEQRSMLRSESLPERHDSETRVIYLPLPGGGAKAVDITEVLDSHRAAPRQREGVAELLDAPSFIKYVNDHKQTSTRIFARVSRAGTTEAGADFCAELDFHDKENPSWMRHKAIMKLKYSHEYETWLQSHDKQKTQTEFAELLEDNLQDIIEPTGADLLEICRDLQIKKDVAFRSYNCEENGDIRFSYEEIEDANERGTITIPSTFRIQIPLFDGTEPEIIQARFRYRLLSGGTLSLSYKLLRVQPLLMAVIENVAKKIESETETPILCGQFQYNRETILQTIA